MDRHCHLWQQVLRDPEHRSPGISGDEVDAVSQLSKLSANARCTDVRAIFASNWDLYRRGNRSIRLAARPLRPVDNVTELPLDKETIADQLRKAGYATGMFGKWHLGDKGDHHPSKRGFDEAIVSAGKHFNFATNPKTEYEEGTYLADFLTDKAVDFIKRKKDGPFFLYLPHYGVHSPHDAKESWIKHFEGKPGHGGHNSPVYAAMIASVDESVGRILKLLDDLKIADNTVVVFTSDNGGVGGYQREGVKKEASITDNAPLRSGKGSLYEGGTRDPFIVRWPGKVAAGSTCDEPTIHVDVYPTLLEIAGAKKPQQELDGESMVKLFTNAKGKLERQAIYQHFPGYLGAGKNQWRTTPVGTIEVGDWKLMEFFEDGRLELYNLKDDIGEQNNLAKSMPEKTQELHKMMIAWRGRVGAKMPERNEAAK